MKKNEEAKQDETKKEAIPPFSDELKNSAETGDSTFLQQEEKPARKKRRSKAEIQAEKEQVLPYSLIDKDTCKLIATIIPFSLLAITLKDKRYFLTDSESDRLAPQWDKVITKYLPDYLSKYGAEASLGISICMLLIQKSGFLSSLQTQEVKTDEEL
jgi:hypothetical protein